MKDEVFFQKNLELATEFSKYVLSHPEIEKEIPENAQVVFLIEEDSDLTTWNREAAKKQMAQGQPVVFVRTKGLRPEISRLIEPRLEKASGF